MWCTFFLPQLLWLFLCNKLAKFVFVFVVFLRIVLTHRYSWRIRWRRPRRRVFPRRGRPRVPWAAAGWRAGSRSCRRLPGSAGRWPHRSRTGSWTGISGGRSSSALCNIWKGDTILDQPLILGSIHKTAPKLTNTKELFVLYILKMLDRRSRCLHPVMHYTQSCTISITFVVLCTCLLYTSPSPRD